MLAAYERRHGASVSSWRSISEDGRFGGRCRIGGTSVGCSGTVDDAVIAGDGALLLRADEGVILAWG